LIPTASTEESTSVTEEELPKTVEKMGSIVALEENIKTAEILRHKVKAGAAKHQQGQKKKADVLRRCLPATGLTIDRTYCHIEMIEQLQVNNCIYV
jgi:hypothetical protein